MVYIRINMRILDSGCKPHCKGDSRSHGFKDASVYGGLLDAC